jgi:hypothetical protein
MFISNSKQRRDRNIVQSSDMGAGTSDNRCNEFCFFFPPASGEDLAFLSFFVVLGFELMASQLLGRCSTA